MKKIELKAVPQHAHTKRFSIKPVAMLQLRETTQHSTCGTPYLASTRNCDDYGNWLQTRAMKSSTVRPLANDTEAGTVTWAIAAYLFLLSLSNSG